MKLTNNQQIYICIAGAILAVVVSVVTVVVVEGMRKEEFCSRLAEVNNGQLSTKFVQGKCWAKNSSGIYIPAEKLR